jgi:hypothetical protein
MTQTKKLAQGDRVEILPTGWEKHINHGTWRAALPLRGIIVEVREAPTGGHVVYRIQPDGAPTVFGFGISRLRLLSIGEVLAELA